jgi:hypothetical protein
MAWHLDPVAQAQVPLDRDEPHQDPLTVLAFEAALLTELLDLVA